MHPDKGDDSEDGEHANDNAGGAFGPVGGREGLLYEGKFRVGIFGVGLLVFASHAGFRRLGICEEEDSITKARLWRCRSENL